MPLTGSQNSRRISSLRLPTLAIGRRTVVLIVSASLFVGVFVAVFLYGWITDDAFITFRVARNFVQGYGLVYNIGERVQSYTHPLWFFLLSAGAFLGFDLYYWALFLGYALTALTLVLLWRASLNAREPVFAALVSTLILISSDTFLSFQTSGLENPLVNALLVGLVLTAARQDSACDLFKSILCATLILLTRLDQLFVVAPLCLYCLVSNRAPWQRKIRVALLTSLPLVAWEMFSVLYYGFLFPNPKYAKVGPRELFEALYYGCHYVADWALFEPAQFLLVVFLPAFLVWSFWKHYWLFVAVAAAVTCQFCYVLAVGGDFMRGRFMLSSLIVAVTAIPLLLQSRNSGNMRSELKALMVLALICFGSYSRHVVNFSVPREDVTVHNERRYFKAYLGVRWFDWDHYKQHPWAVVGRETNAEPRGTGEAIIGMNGQRGFNVDPEVALIDTVGITDAFVARCPVRNVARSGHFRRTIPDEYIQERRTGKRVDGWEDPELEALWRDLQIVISNPQLLSSQRWHAMWRVWKEAGF